MTAKPRLVFALAEDDRLANHIPEWLWKMSRDQETFIRDAKTGELVQVLDMQHLGAPDDPA